MVEPALVCHGGAGHGARDQPGVDIASAAGWDVLTSGGTALQAVLDAVMIMEDDTRLNAGTGGRMRDDGSVQLDAAVATSDGRLGMVMAIEETPNPILVAAELLDEPFHALAGEGARTWADSKGVQRAPVVGSPRPIASDTVGAIAREQSGALAVASSTGGCTGRPPKCTMMISFGSFPFFFAIFSLFSSFFIDIFHVSGSISIKSIFKPHKIPQFAVATKELGTVQNKSPDFNDSTLQAKRRAELPLFTVSAYLLPTKFFILFSNLIVIGP